MFVPFQVYRREVVAFLLGTLRGKRGVRQEIRMKNLRRRGAFSFFRGGRVLFLRSLFGGVVGRVFHDGLRLRHTAMLLRRFPRLALRHGNLIKSIFRSIKYRPCSAGPLLLRFPRGLRELFRELCAIICSKGRIAVTVRRAFRWTASEGSYYFVGRPRSCLSLSLFPWWRPLPWPC